MARPRHGLRRPDDDLARGGARHTFLLGFWQ